MSCRNRDHRRGIGRAAEFAAQGVQQVRALLVGLRVQAMGLKLDPRRMTVPRVVIDRLEKAPIDN